MIASTLAAACSTGTGNTQSPRNASKGNSARSRRKTAPRSTTATKPGAPSGNLAPGSKNCKPNDPDSCFTPTKLKPGQQPPQFVIFSFDGAGWHQKWQYYQHIADQVPLRFTGFLTGLYLVDGAHRDAYHPPGHPVGESSLGPGTYPNRAEVVQEINDLNEAYERGDGIGTIFNGHWCADNPPGGPQWNTAQWTSELSQFMHFVKDYKKVDDDPGLPTLKFGDNEIQGDRTPCLQGNTSVYYPVMKKYGFTYDSSPDRQGLYWPRKDPATGLWMMGMPDWWIAGTDHYQIMMDWNFWYSQEGGSEEHGNSASPAKAKRDGRQMLQTYWNMYHAAYNGNRAPIVIGNHFNDWNHNTYTNAIGKFMLGVCKKPDTYCVPFRDVVRWMDAQSPSVMHSLQALPPELPKKGVDDKPVS